MAISNSASGFRPGVCTSTTRPQAPFNGQVIYETDTKQTLVWQGSAWVMLTDADQPPGLQLVASRTLNANTTNIEGCFTSEFRNYRIVLAEMNSTAGFFGFKMLNGSTPNSSGYSFALSGRTNTGATPIQDVGSSLAYGVFGYIYSSVAGGCAAGSYDIMSPQISTTRTWLNGGYDTFNFGTSINFYNGGCVHDSVAAYDGIQILTTAAGALTGQVRIYGYRD